MISIIIGSGVLAAGAYGLYKLGANDKTDSAQINYPSCRTSRSYTHIDKRRHSGRDLAAPRRNDLWAFERDNNLRVFYVAGTESHCHTIDTSDRNSTFYGPVWTSILGAYQDKGFIRGRIVSRNFSGDRVFSGYDVDIADIRAFLPNSKAGSFYNYVGDPVGKCVAISILEIETLGRNAGTVRVNAFEPMKMVQMDIKKLDLRAGSELEALAIDHDGRDLIFPIDRDGSTIRVSLNRAMDVARRAGCPNDPGLLTGRIWHLKIISRHGDGFNATPIEAYN